MEVTQIFHHAKNYNLHKKSPLKETKILQDIIIRTSIITNLSSFNTIAKISSFKNPQIKIDLLLLPSKGQNPLSYYTL